MAIKFEIYRDGQRLEEFEPVAAIPMGAESIPAPGDVVFENGLLHINRSDESATGVSLLWNVGPLGQFQMETTRLIHRPKPYNLNVELARFRLMKIVQKQEDWNLFDFPRAERFGQMFKEAQSLFADALGKQNQPAEAADLADQALEIATDLSEQLALFHSDLLINRRRATGQFVKHIFGSRIDSTQSPARYRETVSWLDYVVVPMSWKQVQPEEHAFAAQRIDEWMDLLNQKRLPVIAGPLLNFNEIDIPDWMFIWEHDFDAMRDLAHEHVRRVVQRYRRGVAVWNVVAGLSANRLFPASLEQSVELTRLLIAQVKALIPGARTLVTINQPFGEYHAMSPSTSPPMLYAEMVSQAGIAFEGFGLELEIGIPTPESFVRDLFQISCMLDRFSTLSRPVFLTAVCAPDRNEPDPADRSEGKSNPAQAGRWHRPWDPQLQADWMEAVYRVALSKPYVESIAWGNLADINPTLPGGGLLDGDLQPKPIFNRLQEMRTRFHQWSRWT